MRRRSLFGICLVSYLRITALLVVLIGLYGCYIMRQFHVAQTERELEARARVCAKQLAPLLARDDPGAIDALAKELGGLIDTRITVILDTGVVVGDTSKDPGEMENHRDRPEIKQAASTGVGRAVHFSRTLKEDRMYVAVATGKDGSPRAFVRTSLTIPSINKTLTTLYLDFLFGGLVIAGLVTGISVWMSLRISRSLEASSVASRDVESGSGDA